MMPGCGSGGRRQCRYLGFCGLWAGSAGAVRPGRCYAAAGARRVRPKRANSWAKTDSMIALRCL